MSRTQSYNLKVAGSLVRCPFCHDTIEVEAKQWLACADCMARHHEPCWGESGRCGNCGGAEALTRAAPPVDRIVDRDHPSLRLPLLEREEAPTRHERLQNGPSALILDAEFDGELDLIADTRWFERAMRAASGQPGGAQLRGRTLLWQPHPCQDPRTATHASTRASLRVKEGRTRLRVQERYEDLYVSAYTVGVALGGGSLGLVFASQLSRDSGFLLFPLIALALLVAYGIVRSWLVPRLLADRRARLVGIVDRLAAQLERPDNAKNAP